jgi:hypothetical protein
MLDVVVDLHEFVVGRHIEAGALFKQRFDDLLLRVGLHRVVTLDAGQVL